VLIFEVELIEIPSEDEAVPAVKNPLATESPPEALTGRAREVQIAAGPTLHARARVEPGPAPD
jgi:hypothetical protein